MSTPSQSPRPTFEPVDTSFDPIANAQRDDVESPSLSSSNALARFEFEPGRSKEGTKVLMVEWEDDNITREISGVDWEISWEGKRTVLPAKGQSADTTQDETPINRLYFLLGKKGVLHTIWAKKRLQVLQNEIGAEIQTNNEGLGLEMALAERDWIEQNFGVLAKPSGITMATPDAMASATASLNSPASPRSPGGGRLMDKLKGLKLGTSKQDLATGTPKSLDSHNPLSPEGTDVAVGSFGSFAALKGMPPPASLAAKPAQSTQPPRRVAVQRPPDSFAASQFSQTGMGSLNAIAGGGSTGFSSMQAKDDGNEDLFALPMSPRSPEMSKSPFSFASQDTSRYAKSERA